MLVLGEAGGAGGGSGGKSSLQPSQLCKLKMEMQ